MKKYRILAWHKDKETEAQALEILAHSVGEVSEQMKVTTILDGKTPKIPYDYAIMAVTRQ